jgi:hypothetical protein
MFVLKQPSLHFVARASLRQHAHTPLATAAIARRHCDAASALTRLAVCVHLRVCTCAYFCASFQPRSLLNSILSKSRQCHPTSRRPCSDAYQAAAQALQSASHVHSGQIALAVGAALSQYVVRAREAIVAQWYAWYPGRC